MPRRIICNRISQVNRALEIAEEGDVIIVDEDPFSDSDEIIIEEGGTKVAK